jgi:LCP family protein required for cell wall assembly
MDNRANKNKNRKKTNKRNKIIMSIIIVLLFIVSMFGSYTFFQLNKIKSTKISTKDEDLGIKPEVKKKLEAEDSNNDITNIALFGLDKREKGENGRSDAIMIASVDKKSKKIKLSSIMRDSYVDVPGHGKTKINHSYSYGGPELAIKTINQNFDMDIRDYVTVDFFSLEKIINAVGGIQVDVKKSEISYINDGIDEQARYAKDNYRPNVTKSGLQTLNGRQAVAYARIRNTGNGDFERTDRQRKVLNELLNKIQTSGVTKYPQIVSELLPYVETSMSKIDIIKLGSSSFLSGIKTIDQERFPVDGYCNSQTIDGVWYLVPDIKATVDQLHNYIFQDVKPKPGTPKF